MSNNDNPIVSIIVPVYNAGLYIDKCIESIVNQNQKDWECIIINDGSTDDSLRKCQRWSSTDRRIRIIDQNNSGVSVARNNGIQAAKGFYLYFLDADDWCEFDIFPKCVKADMIIGEYIIETDGDSNYISFLSEPLNNYGLTFLKGIVKSCMGTYFVKRELVVSHGILYDKDYKYGEDMNFTLRCLLNARNIQYENRPYFHYRKTGISATSKWTLDRFDVYFSWLKLVPYAIERKNEEVAAYINNVLLTESVLFCCRDLLKEGFSYKLLKEFIDSHGEVRYTLKKVIMLKKSSKERWYAYLILNNIAIFSIYIKFLYSWYNIHAQLGQMKRALFNIINETYKKHIR